MEIVKRKKALSVSPLKSSQTVGASLAFLGVNRAIPMMHGSQGCTAFGIVFFVRHFREPIPLQTTAMDQVSSVMGADGNIVEGLKTICEKSNPSLIGVPTTGLAETQGADIRGALKTFREKYPEYNHIHVIPVNTPDFSGCFETGYALAIDATFKHMLPEADETVCKAGERKKQINVLVGSFLTPGDVEVLKEIIESFGLRPVVLPDLSESLDGHLTDEKFSPVTIGGTLPSEIETMGEALATIVVGPSMYKAADTLNKRTGVPDFRFDHLMNLDMVDQLMVVLSEQSGQPVPEKMERQRAQLQDAMLDTHFMLGQARIAIAQDPDLVMAFSHLLTGAGAEVVAAVVPSSGAAIKKIDAESVKIGDLEDLEILAKENKAELVIGNSHATESAKRLGLPLVRAGFPQYDLIGGYQRVWIGYQGIKQALFDFANIMMENNHHHEVAPYYSILAQKPEYQQLDEEHGTTQAHACC